MLCAENRNRDRTHACGRNWTHRDHSGDDWGDRNG